MTEDETEQAYHRPGFWKATASEEVVRRSLKVALLVGTLQVIINQGDVLLAGDFPLWWKIPLTFAVPYCVAAYSSAAQAVGAKLLLQD
jgi:hypothetical protein